MDLVFKCPHCDQQLEVDAGGAGSSLQCPSCGNTITVPNQESAPPPPPPPPPPPKAPEPKHFSVPTHEKVADPLIQKANRPLDVVAKDGDKKMRIRTFKRSDCLEVGKDRFDEKVSEFLEHVGQANIVSINTVNYSAIDMATHNMLEDYGVLVVFKG
jgi:DNA-directed RNA polymerase subunit RPC12/RpoP